MVRFMHYPEEVYRATWPTQKYVMETIEGHKMYRFSTKTIYKQLLAGISTLSLRDHPNRETSMLQSQA
jgi:hypothetical protein